MVTSSVPSKCYVTLKNKKYIISKGLHTAKTPKEYTC